jgi:thimet oligopeptidase
VGPPVAKEPVASPAADEPAAAADESAAQRFGTACRTGLRAAQGHLAAIVAVAGPRTVDNTLRLYDDLVLELERSWGLGLLMRNVHPDPALRAEAEACEAEVRRFDSEFRRNRQLYAAFAAIDTSSLSAEERRLVELTLRDFRRAGVDRDDATQARLKELDDEITSLGQRFSKNVAEGARWIDVDGPEQLAGMPADWIAAHRPDDNGKIRVTTDYPDYLPFLTYADSGELRRKLYIEFRSRAAEANRPVLDRLLAARHEKASLLGYKNYAEYDLEDKMMKTGQRAQEFVGRVARLAARRRARDYAELLRQKRRGDRQARRVEDYEKPYLAEQIRREAYQVDAKEVRNYFPYKAVQAGLLQITSEIYGISYRPVAEAAVWHEDVDVFDVVADSQPVGRIYLDMHPRADKYKHAAMFPITPGATGRSLPEGALVCNFPGPSAGGAALMEHGDVVTMFHEFGHLMHHIFSGHRTWAALANNERDFVEAPSQAFEEWAWNYQVLQRFAKHHQTGAVIPEALVARMRKAEQFGRGLWASQQLFYAAVSLELHRRDPKNLDVGKLVRALHAKYTPFPFVEGTAMEASFGHLVGYAAGYYTYMWSLVLAKDILSPFLANSLLDPKWNARYRQFILEPGGNKEAAALIEDFLGRPYRFDAFEAWLTKG